MKIGILTFHRPINYGAFLQAYSLSNQLKKCFEKSEVEIIDYIAPKENKTIYLNVLRTLKYYGVDAMIKEIAKITGSFEGTVKTRLFAARKRLKKYLETDMEA